MPTQLKNPSTQVLVLLLGILLLTGVAFGVSGAGLSADTTGSETAQLDVDGVAYRFAPVICTMTDNDFLAAGSGRLDGEPFWISASADGVDLVVGQESETERPHDDQLWLMSVNQVVWESTDGTVTASAVMRDERHPKSRNFRAMLSIKCPEA